MFYFNKDRDYLALIPTIVISKYWAEIDWLNMNIGIKWGEQDSVALEKVNGK